jgi:hypothetical protein
LGTGPQPYPGEPYYPRDRDRERDRDRDRDRDRERDKEREREQRERERDRDRLERERESDNRERPRDVRAVGVDAEFKRAALGERDSKRFKERMKPERPGGYNGG